MVCLFHHYNVLFQIFPDDVQPLLEQEVPRVPIAWFVPETVCEFSSDVVDHRLQFLPVVKEGPVLEDFYYIMVETIESTNSAAHCQFDDDLLQFVHRVNHQIGHISRYPLIHVEDLALHTGERELHAPFRSLSSGRSARFMVMLRR